MENYKIKVITSYKLADAFICQKLAMDFPDLEIMRYKLPVNTQHKWYLKKLKKEGLLKSIDIKLMGAYLGFGNTYNKLINRTLWKRLNMAIPDWKSINAKIYNCSSEDELFKLVKNADCIIALDTLRLPQKFFHQIKAPFLQAVYGYAPFYTGHTGLFWAYSKHDYDKVGISIIQRGKYFTLAKILKTAEVSFSSLENLRSLRTKGAVKIAEVLPKVIETVLKKESALLHVTPSSYKTFCTTPTLSYYLKFKILNVINSFFTLQKEPNRKHVQYEI